MPVLQPVGTNVIVEIITMADKFAEGLKQRSGLLVAANNLKTKEPNTGRVYAVGPHVPDDRLYIIGDVVVFHKDDIFQGFEFEGKKLVTVDHDEIVARLDEAKS